MTSHTDDQDEAIHPPYDMHDGKAREAPERLDEPMHSHFGAVSNEGSPVTPVGINPAGHDQPHITDAFDPKEEFTEG